MCVWTDMPGLFSPLCYNLILLPTVSQAPESLSVTYAKHSSSVEALCVGVVLKYSISLYMCMTHKNLPACTLPPTNSSPCWITALLPSSSILSFPPTSDWVTVWALATLLSWGLHWTLGYCPLIINYRALLPHLEQARLGMSLAH